MSYPDDFDGIHHDAPALELHRRHAEFRLGGTSEHRARRQEHPHTGRAQDHRESRLSGVRCPRWSHGRPDRRSARLSVRSIHACLYEREVCGLSVGAAGCGAESTLSRPERLRRPTALSRSPARGPSRTGVSGTRARRPTRATTCFHALLKGSCATWASRTIRVSATPSRTSTSIATHRVSRPWGRCTTLQTRISTPFGDAVGSSRSGTAGRTRDPRR